MNVTDLNRQNAIGGRIVDDKRNENDVKSNIATTTETMTKHPTSLCKNNGAVPLDCHNDNDGNNNECEDSSADYSDSDSDFDDIVPSPSSLHNNSNQLSSSGIMMTNTNLDTTMPRQSSLMCANNDIKPNIGSIAVQNSSNITFGDKTFYQGPVTIKQFIYDKNNKWKETESPPSAPKHDDLGSTNIGSDKLSQMHMENIDQHDEIEKKWRCSNKQSVYGSTLAGILVCSLLALILIIKYSTSTPNRDTSASDIITDTAGPLRVISRKEWIAQPPSNKLESLDLPVSRVIIAHTATENCTTQAECTFQVRTIQTFHIESRGWDDIGYNFLVGGDGAIYVGRSWDIMGAHTKGFNTNSICFAFIGTFNTVKPPKRQLVAVQKMIVEGVKLGKLTADYSLYGHRQLISTQSPGQALYEIIQTWDHWTNKPDAVDK